MGITRIFQQLQSCQNGITTKNGIVQKSGAEYQSLGCCLSKQWVRVFERSAILQLKSGVHGCTDQPRARLRRSCPAFPLHAAGCDRAVSQEWGIFSLVSEGNKALTTMLSLATPCPATFEWCLLLKMVFLLAGAIQLQNIKYP